MSGRSSANISHTRTQRVPSQGKDIRVCGQRVPTCSADFRSGTNTPLELNCHAQLDSGLLTHVSASCMADSS